MKLPWKKSGSPKSGEPVESQLPKADPVGDEKSPCETDMNAGAEKGKKSILSRAKSILGRGASIIQEKLRKPLPLIGKKMPEKTEGQTDADVIEKPDSSLSGEKATSQERERKDPAKQNEPLPAPKLPGKKSASPKSEEPAGSQLPKSEQPGDEISNCEAGMNAGAENGKKSILSRAKSILGRGASIIQEKLPKPLPLIGKKKPEKTERQDDGEDVIGTSAPSLTTEKSGVQKFPCKDPAKQSEPLTTHVNSGESKKEKSQKPDLPGPARAIWSHVKSFLGRGKNRAAEAAKKAGRMVSDTARKTAAAVKRVTEKPSCAQWLHPASEIGQAALGSTLIGRIFFVARGSYAALIQALTKDFREEVTKNIVITIFTSLARWAIFVGLIWGAHALAVRNGEPTQDWVACAILFLIMPYYFTCWFGCLAWYIGAVRKDRELMFHPLDLIYTYIYNRINSQFPRFLRVIPLLSGKISRDIIDKAMKDPLLWLNVGVSLALFLTGWILYLVYYDKVFFHATGIHFKYIWDPFIWPFLTLMK